MPDAKRGSNATRGDIDHQKPAGITQEHPVVCYACDPPKTFVNADYFDRHVREVHLKSYAS